MAATRVKDNKEKCPACNKEHPVRDVNKVGNPIGSSHTLALNLTGNKGVGAHPLHFIRKISERYRPGSLQAHHLILSSTCNKNDNYRDLFIHFGYDINCKENGIMLPYFMDFACLLRRPVHNTNHDGGEIIPRPEKYAKYSLIVRDLTKNILEKYDLKQCERNKNFIIDMNKLSKKIKSKILNFKWTISKDGLDYAPGNPKGCGNSKTYKEKVGKNFPDCDCKRNHTPETEKIKKLLNKLK